MAACLGLAGERTILVLETPQRAVADLLGAFTPYLLEDGRALYCFDASNSFSPYAFACSAQRLGQPAGPLLGRIYVSRSFTIHQLEASLATMLRPLLAGAAPWPLIAVLGVDRLFTDEDVPRAERRLVLERTIGHLHGLPRGAKVLVTHEALPVNRTEPARLIARLGDRQGRIRPEADGTLGIDMREPGAQRTPATSGGDRGTHAADLR